MAKKIRAPKRPTAVDASVPLGVSQPSARQSVFWTPQHLEALNRQVDGGDLFRLGDLCDQIIADDRIGELLETLAGEVLGCDLTFETGPKSSTGDAEKADELTVDWPKGYDDDEITALIKWTLMCGVGFAKHERWVDSENGRIVPQLKWWNPKHFSTRQRPGALDVNDKYWHVRNESGLYTPITAGDGTWVIATRVGEYRPWANGLWRGLAPWWLLKQYARQDAGIASEKSTKLVVTSADQSTSEQRKAIVDYIYAASKDAVIALPVGFDMKLLEVTANTRDVYLAQVDACNEAAAITILGQNLTTNVTGGSFAAAKEHTAKENRKVRYAAQAISKTLHTQSLTWWAEFNFGDRALAPYPKWHTEPAEDILDKALAWKGVGDTLMAFKNAGYKLSVKQVEEEFGLELEESLAEPVPAVAPPKPGKPVLAPPAKKPAVALASGDDPSTVPGFVAGQVYVDALTDKSAELAGKYNAGFVAHLLAAVDRGGDSYFDVRAEVLKAFSDEEDPDRLVTIVECGLMLANLAGRHAVDVDSK